RRSAAAIASSPGTPVARTSVASIGCTAMSLSPTRAMRSSRAAASMTISPARYAKPPPEPLNRTVRCQRAAAPPNPSLVLIRTPSPWLSGPTEGFSMSDRSVPHEPHDIESDAREGFDLVQSDPRRAADMLRAVLDARAATPTARVVALWGLGR